MKKTFSALSSGQNFIKLVILCLTLTGCAVETDFIYALEIKNELATTIQYCSTYGINDCKTEVKAGEKSILFYRGRSKNVLQEPGLFDDLRVKVCGKPVEFKFIREIFPVIEYKRNHFEIAINKNVYEAFCSAYPETKTP